MGNTAVIAGATGEVGNKILNELLTSNYYSKIYIIGRDTIKKIKTSDKIEKIIVDFEKLDFNKTILNGADVFSALGTGTTGEYEKIDYRYPLALAAMCDNRIRSFNIVSAIGANYKSPSYYQKIKGKAEQDLKNYDLGILRIYRPSMLIAPDRKNITKKEKFYIKVFQTLDPLFIWKIKNWRGISPKTLAEVIVTSAITNNKKQLYKYEDIIKIKDIK